MKNLIPLLFIFLSYSSFAAITLVTDLDDTIKITNSGREVDGTINALFSKKVFTGMPEYIEGVKSYVDEIHVLSASPTVLRKFIEEAFVEHKIEVDSLILRNLLRRQSKIEYKVQELIKLLNQNPSDDFILIGDDVGQDPEVFDEIQRHFPNRVIASYIHVINDRSLPKTSVPYWTTFDLLLREYQAGRVSDSMMEEGIQKMMEETEMEEIFPDFAHCPKTPLVWLWHMKTPYAKAGWEMTKKFNKYCLSRLSVIR